MADQREAGVVEVRTGLDDALASKQHRDLVVALDYGVCSCVGLSYFAAAIGNCEACSRISASSAYTAIEVFRVCGLHVFAALLGLLMVFIEFRFPLFTYYCRALSQFSAVRLLVGIFLLCITCYEKNLRLLSLSALSSLFLALFLFTQLTARIVFFRSYREIFALRSVHKPPFLISTMDAPLDTLGNIRRASYGSINDHSHGVEGRRDAPTVGVAAFQTLTDTPDWMLEPADFQSKQAPEAENEKRMDTNVPSWVREYEHNLT